MTCMLRPLLAGLGSPPRVEIGASKSKRINTEMIQILRLFYWSFTQYLLRAFASNKSACGNVSFERGDYNNEENEGQAVA
ncbi:hypothetical protein, partial [Mesorhizobium sp.]|uniref:hypothetical protein n=1 Tax=Mesorhizobium sp. TaxID=1871066 RepID=UPI0025BC906D